MYVWLLFFAAGAMELRLTFASPTTLKTWLADSGVYSGVVDEVSKLATIQQAQENSLVQITPTDISEVAKDTFPPDSLKNDAEGVIDGFYGWFKGNTAGPEFTVDFTSRQAQFAKEMTDKLEAKINALPECTTSGRFSVQAFDPFKADCRPKGVDLTAELTQFENDLSTSKNLLPKTSFTGNDIKIKNSAGQEEGIASAFSWAPKAYKGLLYGPILLIILTVLTALSLIFLSTDRRKGLRRFAGGLMFAGVVMVASGFLLRPAFNKLNSLSSRSLGTQAGFTEHIINPLFEQMNKSYSRYSIMFGTIYIIPSLLTYGALLLTRHRRETEEDSEPEVERHHVPEEPIEQPTEEPAQMPEEPTPSQPAPVEVPRVETPGVPAFQVRPTQRPVTRRPPMIQG